MVREHRGKYLENRRGPKQVNFKRRGELVGSFGYDEILPRLKSELDALIADRPA